MMTKKLILALTVCVSPLMGCQFNAATSPNGQNKPQSHVLATLQNLEVDPNATHGNTARLIQKSDYCQIEFTGFYDLGKVVENWAFKGDQLISASTTKYSYANNGLSHPAHQQNPVIHNIDSTPFDITSAEKIKNFNNLKKYFSPQTLQSCNL